jgi:anti-sigma factor RsiW
LPCRQGEGRRGKASGGRAVKRLGHTVRGPGLTEAGFELVGGRLLPAAQLMYKDGGGRRVMLYVRRGRPDTDSAFRLVSEDGVGTFYRV